MTFSLFSPGAVKAERRVSPLQLARPSATLNIFSKSVPEIFAGCLQLIHTTSQTRPPAVTELQNLVSAPHCQRPSRYVEGIVKFK